LYGSSSLAGGHTQTQCAHSIDKHRYRRRSISTHIDTDEGHRYRRKSSLSTQVIVIDESHRYRRKSSLSTKVIVIDESHRYRRKSSLSTSHRYRRVIVIDASHRYRRKSSLPTKVIDTDSWGRRERGKVSRATLLGGLARWFPRALVCGRGIRNSGKLPPAVRATDWKIRWAFPSWKIPFGQSYLRGIPLPNSAHSTSCKNPAPRAYQQRRVARTEDRLITRARDKDTIRPRQMCAGLHALHYDTTLDTTALHFCTD